VLESEVERENVKWTDELTVGGWGFLYLTEVMGEGRCEVGARAEEGGLRCGCCEPVGCVLRGLRRLAAGSAQQ
jgi:hypothetical protein